MQPGKPMPGQAMSVSTCLVVDDDTFDRNMIKRCVTRERPGLRMFECATLAEARRFLDKGHADLILIDNRMPDGLGSEFASELRANRRLSDAVICVVTNDDPRLLDTPVATLSKDRLSTRSVWEMIGLFLEERQILRDTEQAQLVSDFGARVSHGLAPGVARMLRSLRMARARLSRRDPEKALDELDKLEEMLLALSDVVAAPDHRTRK